MNLRQTIDMYFGGPGSGCDPEVAKANGTTCGRPPGSGNDVETFKSLKAQWATINNKLLDHVNEPDSNAVNELMAQLKDTVKQIHSLNIDPGGWEGIGLPGGARDLLIVGGGPGGLAAAMMGASDGLDTLFVEAQQSVGGQARYSSRIENYPGFPVGVTGETLAKNIYEQATRLGAEEMLGVRVTGLSVDDKTGMKTVTLSNGKTETARAVVIAGGVEFRKMVFPGSESPNIVYGDGQALKQLCEGGPAVVIGGSNGAAQAALGVTSKASHVYLLSRSPVANLMSDYQIQAIKNNPKITVIENDEIQHLFTDDKGATSVKTKGGKTLPMKAMGIFVGSAPKTEWLPPGIKKKDGKIVVNSELETDVPGVFAIGDIRVGGIGRIGGAVGDGQLAERNVFPYFDRQKKKYGITAAKGNKLSKKAFDDLIDRLFDMDKQHPFFGQTVEK